MKTNKIPLEVEDAAIFAVILHVEQGKTMDPAYVVPNGVNCWIVNEYVNGKLFQVKVKRQGCHIVAE